MTNIIIINVHKLPTGMEDHRGIRPRELDWPAKLSQVRTDKSVTKNNNTKFIRCEAADANGQTKLGGSTENGCSSPYDEYRTL